MKRTHEDIIESHKRRKEEQHMHVYVNRKKHHQDNYDSLLNLKKPNLDIQGHLQTSSYGQSKLGMYLHNHIYSALLMIIILMCSL